VLSLYRYRCLLIPARLEEAVQVKEQLEVELAEMYNQNTQHIDRLAQLEFDLQEANEKAARADLFEAEAVELRQQVRFGTDL
jgi:hypothetical protein